MIRQTRLAVRAFLKRPVYSFINVFGLGLGLACFALISLFVKGELSYDRHHEDADRIYRVGFRGTPPNSATDEFAVVSNLISTTIRDDFPEVEALTRMMTFSGSVLKDGEHYYDDQFLYVDDAALDVFTVPFVSGAREGALERPNTVVISESMAEKYFDIGNPVGQMLVVDDSLNWEVTAVMEDIPATSHFQADFLLSFATVESQFDNNAGWLNLGLYAYLKTRPGIDFSAFEAGVANVIHDHIGEDLDAMNFKTELLLEPLTGIYLTSKLGGQIGATGDMTQVWVFSAVALFILLLAGINFTNLSTARSMERAREVGVRKSIGSTRSALVIQFLGESVTLAMFSLVVGLIMAAASLELLNELASRDIAYSALLDPELLGILVGATLLSGLLGGLYPALLLSGFNPVDVLKGSNHSSKTGAFVRKSLVTTQFAISIGLITGTIVVNQQLDWMQNRDLGFNKEQMLVVDAQAVSRRSIEGRTLDILAQFEQLSLVQEATLSQGIPGRGSGRVLFRTENLSDDDIRSADVLNVGRDWFETYGIPLVAGRSFDPARDTDLDDAIIINESLAEYAGFQHPEDALGVRIPQGGGNRMIIGVLTDYHHSSLKDEIQPTLYYPTDRIMNFVSLRIAGQDAVRAVEEVGAVWSTLFPEIAFESFFLDDDFNRQYQQEERLQRIFSLFSILAIAIACLGLFGLAAFTAQQWTKEIGIRKVMGASVGSLVGMLSREFAILVLVGLVIAIPISLWGLNQWLEPFPYRIDIAWWVFAVSGAMTLGIALATVGWQAMRAASIDPIKSLRYE